jgi:hypothetical protein
MGYPELAEDFAKRVQAAQAILARKTGRTSYGRRVIQAWLLENNPEKPEPADLIVTSLTYLAVARGWARYAPYRQGGQHHEDLLLTAQTAQIMMEAEKKAEQDQLGMFARENAPTLQEMEAFRTAKRRP